MFLRPCHNFIDGYETSSTILIFVGLPIGQLSKSTRKITRKWCPFSINTMSSLMKLWKIWRIWIKSSMSQWELYPRWGSLSRLARRNTNTEAPMDWSVMYNQHRDIHIWFTRRCSILGESPSIWSRKIRLGQKAYHWEIQFSSIRWSTANLHRNANVSIVNESVFECAFEKI